MIDERLNDEGQRQVADWIRALPEETPGMAWRAALNEKIRAEAELRIRRRWRLRLAIPGFGLATAAALGLFVLPHASTRVTPSAHRVEASLVALHDQSIEDADIVGSGLNPTEVPASVPQAIDPLDDLDAGVL